MHDLPAPSGSTPPAPAPSSSSSSSSSSPLGGSARPGTLRINEIFHSIQGESTRAGERCVFVRLTGCPLRCRYCDTEYAFREGETRPIDAIVEEVAAFDCPLVEVTGGEPLAQKRVHDLMAALLDRGLEVLIETSGALDISTCDPRVQRIVDLKTPGSGEVERNLLANLDHLGARDEVKFVIVDRADYEWARELVREHDLAARCRGVLMSAVFEQKPGLEILGCPGLHPRALAEWIIEDRLPVRMQTQLHKLIWDPSTRGV